MKKLYIVLLLLFMRISSAFAQWNTNATPVCIYSAADADDYATTSKYVRTPDHKTWIAWKTVGQKAVNGIDRVAVRTYLQLLDSSGRVVFDEPITVNDHITQTWWSEYGLQVADDGSAIVTVADGRAEEDSLPDSCLAATTNVPAIYKIDQQGNFVWGNDGVAFPKYDNAPFTNCYVVGKDTYFIFYNDSLGMPVQSAERPTIGLFIQRMNEDGTPAWEEPRKWTEAFIQPQLLPLTDEEFLLFDRSQKGSVVHRMNRNLEELWGEPLVYDNQQYGGYAMNPYQIVSDGKGGAVVCFVYNTGLFTHQVRVQHINGDGTLAFGPTGLDVTLNKDNDYDYCTIAANPATEEILVHFKSQLTATCDMTLQKFSYRGDYLFDNQGLSIASKSSQSGYNFSMVGCGALENGDWIVVYRDVQAYRDNTSFVIQRYDKDGSRLWSKIIGRFLMPNQVHLFVEKVLKF